MDNLTQPSGYPEIKIIQWDKIRSLLILKSYAENRTLKNCRDKRCNVKTGCLDSEVWLYICISIWLMYYSYVPSFRVQARVPSPSMTTASRLRAVLVYRLAVRKAATARFSWHMQKHQTESFTACMVFWILPCIWRWLYLTMLQW